VLGPPDARPLVYVDGAFGGSAAHL